MGVWYPIVRMLQNILFLHCYSLCLFSSYLRLNCLPIGPDDLMSRSFLLTNVYSADQNKIHSASYLMTGRMIVLWRNDTDTGIERVAFANRSDSCEQLSSSFPLRNYNTNQSTQNINKGNQFYAVLLCVGPHLLWSITNTLSPKVPHTLSRPLQVASVTCLLSLLLYGLFQHRAPGTGSMCCQRTLLKWNIHGHLRF